jgi:hypothetical protein
MILSSFIRRSAQFEQQDLDLLSEPLSSINQRLSNSNVSLTGTSATSSINKIDTLPTASPLITRTYPIPLRTDTHSRLQSTVTDGRSRHNGPLAATTNDIYLPSSNDSFEYKSNSTLNSSNPSRTFVHHVDARSFQLGTAIQMTPMDDDHLVGHGRRRPCHRQNALRYKSIDAECCERQSRPSSTSSSSTIRNDNRSQVTINTNVRYASKDRQVLWSKDTRQISSFDIQDELRPAHISWSVREKAKLFEHQTRTTTATTTTTDQRKFSTGRENYV